jgi:hypothetical protein
MQIVNIETLAITTLAQLRKTTTANIPRTPTAAHLAKFNHAPLVHRDPPAGDKVTRLSVAEKVDGQYYPTFLAEAFTLDEKRALIPARRDLAIYAGITVNNLPIDTDEVTQGRLAGAALQAVIDDTYTVQWKVSGQPVTLTAQEIIGVATAVRAHVQACFDREAELMLMEDPSNADIDTGWPA